MTPFWLRKLFIIISFWMDVRRKKERKKRRKGNLELCHQLGWFQGQQSYQAVQDALDCGKYFPLSIRTVHLLYKWNFPGTHIISKFPSLCYITQSLYFIIEANEQIEIYWLAGVFCSLWCNSPGRNEDIVKKHFSLSIWLSDYWKNGPPSRNFPRKLMTREGEGIN